MAKHKRKSSAGNNSCCPVIHVKCAWAKARPGRGSTVVGSPSLAQRLIAYKEGKLKALKAKHGLAGYAENYGSINWGAKPAASAVATVAQAAGSSSVAKQMRRPGICTVRIGDGKAMKMSSAKAARFVARAVKAQRRRRCLPVVKK